MLPALPLVLALLHLRFLPVTSFSSPQRRPVRSPPPRTAPSNDDDDDDHDVRISIVESNDDILALADLRYREWMSADPNPPDPSSFRLATAEIFREREAEGSTVFLATVLPDADVAPGRKKREAAGAAELSPVEFEGAFVADGGASGGGVPKRKGATASRSCLYVTDVVASSTRRRRGIGSRLMEAVEGRARARGARCLFLHVARDNVAARRFYARLGYEEAERVDQEEGEGNEILRFSPEDAASSSSLANNDAESKGGCDAVVAVDVARLARNAGTVGQLLMTKGLRSEPTSRGGFSAAEAPPSATSASTAAPSGMAGGGFGRRAGNSKKKKRKR